MYLGDNPLYAKEAHKKQGMLFGLYRDSVDTQNRPAAARAAPPGVPFAH